MAKSTDLKSALSQLEDTLELYLVDKAPFSIPSEWKDLIVKFAPYLTLLGIVMLGLSLLSAFGFTSMMGPSFMYFGAFRLGFGYWLMLGFLAATLVLEGLAVKPLFAKEEKGWKLVFYAALVNTLYSIINFSFGGLIGLVILFYVLFQVKSYYK